jgi:hypothetical protein
MRASRSNLNSVEVVAPYASELVSKPMATVIAVRVFNADSLLDY